MGDKPTTPEEMLEVTDQIWVPVQGYGYVELELQQPGGNTAAKLKNETHVQALGRSLLSTRRISGMSGELFIN